MPKVSIVEGLSGLKSLQGDWERLHRSSGAGLFQSFAWARAWAEAIGPQERDIRIVVVEDGDRACIVPLTLQRRLSVRRLRWLGMEVTDYCDVVAGDTWDPAELAACIRSRLPPADLVELRQIRAGSLADRIFGAEPEAGLVCPYIAVADGEYPKDVLYAERRAGALAYEVAANLAERADIVAFVIARKRLTLQRQDRPTAEFDLTVTPFLQRLAGLDYPGGVRPYFSRLMLDGETIAAQIGFIEGGALLYYLPAFDFAHRLHSPGHLLILNLLRDAKAMGLQTVDLLRGDEPYKFKWTDRTQTLSAAEWPATWRGRAFAAARRIRPGRR
jgi:CelD/BcsL family acetyltransferase involved in cellulose biosynthesis